MNRAREGGKGADGSCGGPRQGVRSCMGGCSRMGEGKKEADASEKGVGTGGVWWDERTEEVGTRGSSKQFIRRLGRRRLLPHANNNFESLRHSMSLVGDCSAGFRSED